MGVLAALLLLLPGVAFILGLSRLHNPSKPPTPFDQHFSIGLVSALVAAVAFHALWIVLFNSTSPWTGLLVDASQALPALAGDVKPPAGDALRESMSAYPFRIAFYFLSVTLVAWRLGKRLNKSLRKRHPPTWFDLLQPADADFVWLTVDIKLDSECHLIAGAVQSFQVDRNGKLERVVVAGTMRRQLHCDAEKRKYPATTDGWTEIPGEFMVIQMDHVRTINVDYWYIEGEPDPDEVLATIGPPQPTGEPGATPESS